MSSSKFIKVGIVSISAILSHDLKKEQFCLQYDESHLVHFRCPVWNTR
ncbi:protein of unknown function [Candidatus Nitrosotalea okcheonensis]|uniref:Uncharacterized protein n=1 Tax=Candidatus Nitrosotalea okcheonensis TaxID=1903276 RepID=A0A2H1FI90_9ARCH|nr:protein of unknown function [Candidatus Nitrosotalea okcheonensis]